MTKILLFLTFILPVQVGWFVEVVKITDRILVLNEGYDRVSAVKTSKGIAIIDTHKSTSDMRRMREIIIAHFKDSTFTHVINTHPCLEHINGNSLFPGAIKIAHVNFAKENYPDSSDNRIAFLNKNIPILKEELIEITDSIEKERVQNKLDYYISMRNDFFKAAVPPDLSFTDKMTLRTGDTTFELVYMGDGAHGNSSVLIYIPEEKTLFTGSALAMPPIVYKTGGWIQNQEVEKWISVLDQFLNINETEHIIPSHIQYFTVDDLSEMRTYYHLILSTIKESMSKGVSKEDTFKKMDYTNIDADFNLFTSCAKDKERHDNNIHVLWDYYKNRTVQ